VLSSNFLLIQCKEKHISKAWGWA